MPMKNTSAIPIKNLYYLLSYAWEEFDGDQWVNVGKEEAPQVINLLAKQFIKGLKLLKNEGLKKGLSQQAHTISAVKGKIDWANTIGRQLILQGKTHCHHLHTTYNHPLNQSIKAYYLTLVHHPFLASPLKQTLFLYHDYLIDIQPVFYKRRQLLDYYSTFISPTYPFLIHLGELLVNMQIPTTSKERSSNQGMSILQDRAKMSKIFEQFVRNFYLLEQSKFRVSRPIIRWKGVTAFSEEAQRYLPVMRTDVMLSNGERKIIIDTKFYGKMFQSFHGHDSLISSHLYQLYSYLKNYSPDKLVENQSLEGILLYAASGNPMSFEYQIQDFSFRVKSISLSVPQGQIHKELYHLISEEKFFIT